MVRDERWCHRKAPQSAKRSALPRWTAPVSYRSRPPYARELRFARYVQRSHRNVSDSPVVRPRARNRSASRVQPAHDSRHGSAARPHTGGGGLDPLPPGRARPADRAVPVRCLVAEDGWVPGSGDVPGTLAVVARSCRRAPSRSPSGAARSARSRAGRPSERSRSAGRPPLRRTAPACGPRPRIGSPGVGIAAWTRGYVPACCELRGFSADRRTRPRQDASMATDGYVQIIWDAPEWNPRGARLVVTT